MLRKLVTGDVLSTRRRGNWPRLLVIECFHRTLQMGSNVEPFIYDLSILVKCRFETNDREPIYLTLTELQSFEYEKE